jgi:hypothetical protein
VYGYGGAPAHGHVPIRGGDRDRVRSWQSPGSFQVNREKPGHGKHGSQNNGHKVSNRKHQ